MVSDKGSAGDETSAGPFASSAQIADLSIFHQAMNNLASAAPIVRAREAPSVSPLSELSSYLRGRHLDLAQRMSEVIATRNPQSLLKATATMVDAGVESNLVAKVLGKTVSAIDQLTKLN
jgi:hypothetical protein